MSWDDFAAILEDCDLPQDQLSGASAKRLNPKGFWRIDKDMAPEVRHPVLSLVAFHDLQQRGINEFLAQNDGAGWLLPEYLRLSDLGLGRDQRAKELQPVRSALGERLLDWQMNVDVSRSWDECSAHAAILQKIAPEETHNMDKNGDKFGAIDAETTEYKQGGLFTMLNPITYTEQVVSDFLRYQLSTYAFADTGLYQQMRTLLNLEHTRNTPLMKGPYISLSRTFQQGASLEQLVKEGVLHAHIRQLSPYPAAYRHQEQAFRAIHAGQPTLVATGTGSGKTESFLFPIISHCLKLRDEGATAGVTAVIVYPMNALAEDQLQRMRALLAGTGVTFGMYVGKTPQKESDVVGVRLPPGSTAADYQSKLADMQAKKQDVALHPAEERTSREAMRTPGQQPRILLTNVKQLELLLTRQHDLELFDNARLEFMVFDEAHTFTGAQGAETACLIRRLRAYCGKDQASTTCIATSATIADPVKGLDAGREFASRFFGVDGQNVALVGESYEADVWGTPRTASPPLNGDQSAQLQTLLEVLSLVDREGATESDVQALRVVHHRHRQPPTGRPLARGLRAVDEPQRSGLSDRRSAAPPACAGRPVG